MEHVGAICEAEWNSFTGMCSDESDFMAQLLGNSFLHDEVPTVPHHSISTFWPSHYSNVNIEGVDESPMFSSEETNSSTNCFPQRSSYSGGSSILFPSSSHESYYPTGAHQFYVTNNNLMTMDYGVLENKSYCSEMHIFKNSTVMEGNDLLNQNVSDDSIESSENMPEDALQGNLQPGRETEMPMPEILKEDKASCPSKISKKRPRTRGGIPRSKRNTKLHKCMETDDSDEENDYVVLHRPSSSNCCLEDESNASHERNRMTSSSSGVPKSNGKARAIRGSSADPQSLYARKRRERSNERLRILQNLVPNGTKVDISTMLEEAVQYVKFLQLQIKLLSSDDTWMYAPIAFNGMDLGLDLRISLSKSQT